MGRGPELFSKGKFVQTGSLAMRMTVSLKTLVVALVMAAHAQPSRASEGPWCSHYFGTDYTENCSMRSFDMCIAETRGAGGTFCSPNPRYRAVAVEPGAHRHGGAAPHPM
jgi:Protein of unknown function (DUF3551)